MRLEFAWSPGDSGRGGLSVVRHLVTIGVYRWDLAGFVEALAVADVRVLLDVRQRRGVRGSQYAWVNAVRLRTALATARVDYRPL